MELTGRRRARPLGGRDDRRRRRGDPPRRGPARVPHGDGGDRPARAAQPRSLTRSSEAEAAAAEIGLPLVVRPASRWAAAGGGIAYDRDELQRTSPSNGLRLSPISQVLLEESVAGWHEFELEVMRDSADNVVIICSIENIDPMGVHTGDSVTVAPALTLTDPQYQELRDAAKAIIRKIGVDTGGSNVQFAVHPETGEVVVIEMNPRVSRSFGARLQGDRLPDRQDRRQAGRRLHPRRDPQRHHQQDAGQLRADARLRGRQDAALGVREVPAWPTAELTTHMKSVGEAMAIGRTFKEAFLKAMRSRELDSTPRDLPGDARELAQGARGPTCERYELDPARLPSGHRRSTRSTRLTEVPQFFLAELRDIVELEREVRAAPARSARRCCGA